MPAGASTTCCPISARPRTTSAAPDEFHGAGGPLGVSDVRDRIRSPRPISRRRSNAAIRATTISTARRRKAPAIYQTTMRNGLRCSAATAYLQAGAPARQSHRGVGCARDADSVRGAPRGRRRISGRRRDAHGARRRRGDRRVGHVQLAAAAAALRARPGGAAAIARHSGRRRHARASARGSTIIMPAASSCAARSRSRSTTRCAAGAARSPPGLRYALHAPRLSHRLGDLGRLLRARASVVGDAGFAVLDRALLRRPDRRHAASRSRA